MIIDLKNEELFDADELIIDKKVTFAYGKNGTGKSTLTRILQKQEDDYDVRIFQGFEQVVGENHRLNAVVLGEENEKIENQIKSLNREKEQLLQEMEKMLKTISAPEDTSERNSSEVDMMRIFL